MKGLCFFHCRFIAVFFCVSKSALGIEKYWLPNLEWETASNWLNNRVPDTDSQVIFPLQTRHAVGIARSRDLSLSEIDLARSGSLVLSRNGKLQLSELKKSITKVSNWLREGHFFWADPGNWGGSSDAAPHLERVPCRQDDIVLPETNRTFSILLPMKDIQVQSIRTSDQKHPFTRWQWEQFRDRREFDRGRFTVKYSEYNCDKCSCQDDLNGDYFEEICAIQRPRCGFTACEYPLTVEGHCCRYCGGRISLSNKASLLFVRASVIEALEGRAEKLSWHVRRTWNGGAEVLIKEKGDYSGIDIYEAIESVKSALQNAGIEVLSAETAGAALQDSRLAVTLGPFFGAPLIALALFALVFSYFGYSYRHILSGCGEAVTSIRDGFRADKPQSGKPFSFARFENIPEGNVQIADAASTSEQKVENNEETGKNSWSGGRFENPLYRSKRRREEERKIVNMEAPLSLATLRDKEEDRIEEVEMDIDQ